MSTFFEFPETRDPTTGKAKARGSICAPGWQATGSFYVSLIGLFLFSGLILGIMLKGDELHETSRATVSMHEETTKMKTDISAWVKEFRSHFPANQETMTTEQVLDSIDKGHATMVWIDQVRRAVPPASVETIVGNVNRLVGNATLLVEMITAVFNSPPTGSREEKDTLSSGRERFIGSATNVLTKGSELLNSVSATEFHAAFETGHAAIQAFVRLSQSVDHVKVARLVDSASDILGAADTSHIVSVVSELSKGASEIIRRFSRPGGLRLSLPVEDLMSPSPLPPVGISPNQPILKD